MAILENVGSAQCPRFSENQCVEQGQRLSGEYQSAEPFPHIAIDDFLPLDMLREVRDSFPPKEQAMSYKRVQENLKYQFHPEAVGSDLTRNLFMALNSEPFLKFLSAMTGIEGLIADPYYTGGGLHETLKGGHLGIHADFNRHKIMNVRRRLNLLVYLNDDWKDEYGGHLELWSTDMKEMRRKVAPVLGRCVIFNTDLDSYHGHPDPLATPDGMSRRSLATYYYTSAPTLNDQPDRTTNFQKRPGSSDKSDHAIKLRETVKEWMPPALMRMVKKARS